MADKKHYNRKDRKNLEKNLGLQKPKSKKERDEFATRKIAAGKQIHQTFTEYVLNEQEKQAAERESEQMKGLMKDLFDTKGNLIKKGMTYEEAKAFVLHNYEIERKRAQKLAQKEAKRKHVKQINEN